MYICPIVNKFLQCLFDYIRKKSPRMNSPKFSCIPTPHKPQTEAATCVLVTLTLPKNPAWLLVNTFIAVSAMLNPLRETSIARTFMLFAIPDELVYVNCQHVPQFAEFHDATAWAPPMKGNLGREPKVVNLGSRPLEPLEQATTLSEVEELS